MIRSLALALMAVVATAAAPARGDMFITEFMYSGDEFIEFTNTGTTAIDMTGWSFDDDSQTPGTVDLSAFGIVAAGESVILAESDAATFRANWNLADTVRVIGGNTTNLGRNDEINLYNSAGDLVDRLTYGDQTLPGSIRTQDVSGWANDPAVLGANDIYDWQLAAVGDAQGSYASVAGQVGSPGRFVPVPEPAAVVSLGLGLPVLGLAIRRRRRAG